MAKPGTFQKGQSGNPAGKPKGTRHRYSVLAEQLMGEDIEDVTRAVLIAARDGDMTAARIVLDRIAPARRDQPIPFKLPPIDNVADLPKATNALLQAVATGELTPSEAAEFGKLIDAHVRAVEITDINARVAALEARGT